MICARFEKAVSNREMFTNCSQFKLPYKKYSSILVTVDNKKYCWRAINAL